MWKKSIQYLHGTGIQTHTLQNMSLLPQLLDKGSRPYNFLFYPNIGENFTEKVTKFLLNKKSWH